MKKRRSKSTANRMDDAVGIIKKYEDLIASNSDQGKGWLDKKEKSVVKTGNMLRTRSRSMSVVGKDLRKDMMDLEYKKLKRSCSVLNVAFKEYKKGAFRIKKRGPVAVKGHQKLNTLSKNVTGVLKNFFPYMMSRLPAFLKCDIIYR